MPHDKPFCPVLQSEAVSESTTLTNPRASSLNEKRRVNGHRNPSPNDIENRASVLPPSLGVNRVTPNPPAMYGLILAASGNNTVPPRWRYSTVTSASRMPELLRRPVSSRE